MYLGVLVKCNMSCISIWKGVVENFKNNLSTWKACILSIGGRLVLMKALIENLPTYYMSLYRLLVVMKKNLKCFRHKFL